MGSNLTAAVRFFSDASDYVQSAGLSAEVAWQRKTDFSSFTEYELLREHAWVTLCSGFRESVVRRLFDKIALCFCDWESAESIVSAGDVCCETAASSFGNRLKLNAIFATAKYINRIGFIEFKRAVLADPINELQKLSFIGPITSWHLAKNLGLDVVKPDRHLIRLAESLGFRSVRHLCGELAAATGEQAKVVDLIVWRYIADNPNKLHILPTW